MPADAVSHGDVRSSSDMTYRLFEKKYTPVLLASAVVVAAILVFSISGFFNERIDAKEYASEIVSMQSVWHGGAPSVVTFKPFYGAIGSLLSFAFSPYVSILLINLAFLCGLAWIGYIAFREFDFEETDAAVGGAWIVLSYPMLKYGLALSTDISGWFFAILTIAVFLFAARNDLPKHAIFASLIAFLGSTAKETGALGLIFCGMYILFQIGVWQKKKVAAWLAYICVPFLALQFVLIYCMQRANGLTLVQWFSHNQDAYGQSYRTLSYFLGVEGSTFNMIAIIALIGIFVAFKNRDLFKRSWLATYVPLAVASIPVLVWPIFISRVLFAQYMFFVPLALYGLAHIRMNAGSKKAFGIPLYAIVAAAPIVVSVILFVLSGNGSLFSRI